MRPSGAKRLKKQTSTEYASNKSIFLDFTQVTSTECSAGGKTKSALHVSLRQSWQGVDQMFRDKIIQVTKISSFTSYRPLTAPTLAHGAVCISWPQIFIGLIQRVCSVCSSQSNDVLTYRAFCRKKNAKRKKSPFRSCVPPPNWTRVKFDTPSMIGLDNPNRYSVNEHAMKGENGNKRPSRGIAWSTHSE